MSVRLGDIIGQIGTGIYKLVNAKDIEIAGATDGTGDGAMAGTDLLICDTDAAGAVKKITISQIDVDTLTNIATAINIGANDLSVRTGGQLHIRNAVNTYGVKFKVDPDLAASTIYTLPSADGDNGDLLSTNGSGTLSWAGGISAGGNDTEVQYNDSGALAGAASVAIVESGGNYRLTLTENLLIKSNHSILLYDSDNSHYVGLSPANTTTTSVTYELPAADGTDGQILSTNGSGALGWVDNTASSTFVSLTDTPANFTGSAGKFAKVNVGETALEFATGSGSTSQVSVYLSGNQTITTATFTKVLLDTENFDTANDFASNKFLPGTAGYYLICSGAGITPMATGKMFAVMLYKNGTRIAMSEMHSNLATDALAISTSRLVYLNGSTDYVELYVYHNSGGDEQVYAGNDWTYMTAFGPV